MVSTAGGARSNEDRVGYRGTLAWVIDGATDLYQEAVLPAASDVQWLVDTVAQQLADAGADGYRDSATVLLEAVADDVASRQAALGFPASRVPPACSVALCVDQGPRFDISRIGDATAVVVGPEPVVLATSYFDRREAAAVAAGEPDPQRVTAAMHERRVHTMTSGDSESVFSGHPRRVLRPHRVGGAWSAADSVLLCTDGFARLVTDYGIYPEWANLVRDALEHGLPHLEKLIREAEHRPERGGGRFKRADDVAAVLLTGC
ncbi:protein phosphatase 2C domain-containing protein [Micromonospora sp. WMMD1082]|uniref:protein phosphatase 2C domain-containing protein n=1 Tax=Micromonospora sp. WMMD1082 TaxID=3016104 RepID=UPI0024175EDE|nr:protein phosphatase 2C domain-containing protein [Micromonospora sp. WMMD1082]MDG4797551.1 protein phosphatase 2C domain-containing protein [Micromonospora sp. WMMD1082]